MGFRREIKDVFLFYFDNTTFESYYKNGDKQKDYGIEAEAATTIAGKLQVSANYTYVDGKITTALSPSKDTSYFNLFRRPQHTINVTAGYQVCKAAYVSAHVRRVSKFYEPKYASAPYTMKGYYTLDLYGEYKAGDHVKLFTDLQNLTSQRYFDTRGFNSRRFNWSAGVLLNW